MTKQGWTEADLARCIRDAVWTPEKPVERFYRRKNVPRGLDLIIHRSSSCWPGLVQWTWANDKSPDEIEEAIAGLFHWCARCWYEG